MKLFEIYIHKSDFKNIIAEELQKFCKEFPELINKATWLTPISTSAFTILNNRIIARLEKENITKCPRCGKQTRADILHTCTPGNWRPIKVSAKADDKVKKVHVVV